MGQMLEKRTKSSHIFGQEFDSGLKTSIAENDKPSPQLRENDEAREMVTNSIKSIVKGVVTVIY